jgi:phosphoglycerate dehydrogenase-like enzyme
MNLLIKKQDQNDRLATLHGHLLSDWKIISADHTNREEWFDGLSTVDAVITMDWRNCPTTGLQRLKLVQLPGAGLDAIEQTLIPDHTSICNVFEHEIPIAEFILGSLLQRSLRLKNLEENIRSGSWEGSYLFGPTHDEIYGKTIGIVGYGHIGREVSKRAKAFGMQVVAAGPRPQTDPGNLDRFFEITELREMLALSDYVIVAAPLLPETKGLIGASELAAMKETAIIINVARGEIIQEKALFEACKNKLIGGAVIDTWYRYPSHVDDRLMPSFLPFEDLDNVTMIPHASAWTSELIARRNQKMAENMNRLLLGQPLENIVRSGSSIK